MTLKTITISFDIDDIYELHDRLIAGTGKEIQAEIVTNDPEIISSKHVNTIW